MAAAKPLKAKDEKPCDICKVMFKRYKSTAKVCSVKCGIEWAKRSVAKKEKRAQKIERKEWNAKKRAHRESDVKWQMKRAQKVYNRWIVKVRDADEPCISSGRLTAVQWHCGHYLPSTHSALRFDESNTHKQSSEDNLYRSGNLTKYRIRLIDKIGIDEVERLEGPKEQKKWTCEELAAIHADYSQRLKDAGVSAA